MPHGAAMIAVVLTSGGCCSVICIPMVVEGLLCVVGIAICVRFWRLSGWMSLAGLGFVVWGVAIAGSRGLVDYLDPHRAIDFVLISAVADGVGFLLAGVLLLVGLMKTADRVHRSEAANWMESTGNPSAPVSEPNAEGSHDIRK
jgi:hypothetical protein